MADDCAVTIFDKINNRMGGFTDGGVLILDTLIAGIFYQRIATDGYDKQFGHGSHLAEISSMK